MEQKELINHLFKQGLLKSSEAKVTPLSGGVSCDILLVDDGSNRFVVKSALEKLKVKEDWFADVSRNVTEQKYLKYVSGFLPDAVPQIIYSNEAQHFFCMEMLENGLQNWKVLLLNQQINPDYAKAAGKIMGTVHRESKGDKTVERTFDTLKNFCELRIEPYLIFTGKKHPDLADYFHKEAERLSSIKTCLVHGDFSPKNILVGPGRFVLLDAEVAWYGDPVFDLAFLLNHFVLKALYLPQKAKAFIKLSKETIENYKEYAKDIFKDDFELKLVHLLLMLMLARVDGKSPVEYLNAAQQETIRNFVKNQLPITMNYNEFSTKWLEEIALN